MGETMRREVLLVGGGRVGRHTAKNLPSERYRVTIVERDSEKCDSLTADDASEVIEGDATEKEVLDRAEPAEADIVAALTNDTATNKMVCEMLHERNPEAKKIVRISTDGEEELSHLRFIDNIVYPAAAGAVETAEYISAE